MNEQTKTRMAAIFNEWARRYAESPDSFAPILDEHGQPAEDYGEMATRFFQEISADMEKAEILSQVRKMPVENTGGTQKDKEYLSRAASLIQALLPDNHLFFLLVAQVGQFPNNRVNFTATMQFEDATKIMRELLARLDK